MINIRGSEFAQHLPPRFNVLQNPHLAGISDLHYVGVWMTIRWTHITITVSDFERSIDFYASFCGLSVVRDRRKEGGGTVWLGPEPTPGENPTFVLVISKGEVTDRLDHFGFQCDSREEVDLIAKEAERRGILVWAPQDSGGVVGYWTMLRDPDGHTVEFTFGQPIVGLS